MGVHKVATPLLTSGDEVEGQREGCADGLALSFFAGLGTMRLRDVLKDSCSLKHRGSRVQSVLLTRLSSIAREEVGLWLVPHPPCETCAEEPAIEVSLATKRFVLAWVGHGMDFIQKRSISHVYDSIGCFETWLTHLEILYSLFFRNF
jgi:hypothetical protein